MRRAIIAAILCASQALADVPPYAGTIEMLTVQPTGSDWRVTGVFGDALGVGYSGLGVSTGQWVTTDAGNDYRPYIVTGLYETNAATVDQLWHYVGTNTDPAAQEPPLTVAWISEPLTNAIQYPAFPSVGGPSQGTLHFMLARMAQLLAAKGGAVVTEAPLDTTIYGRSNATWVAVTGGGAGSDTLQTVTGRGNTTTNTVVFSNQSGSVEMSLGITDGAIMLAGDTNGNSVRLCDQNSGDALYVTGSAFVSGEMQVNSLTNSIWRGGSNSVPDLWPEITNLLSGVVAGTGTTDHAALSNLDFASSGHTGFQEAGSYLTAETNWNAVSNAVIPGAAAGATASQPGHTQPLASITNAGTIASHAETDYVATNSATYTGAVWQASAAYGWGDHSTNGYLTSAPGGSQTPMTNHVNAQGLYAVTNTLTPFGVEVFRTGTSATNYVSCRADNAGYLYFISQSNSVTPTTNIAQVVP